MAPSVLTNGVHLSHHRTYGWRKRRFKNEINLRFFTEVKKELREYQLEQIYHKHHIHDNLIIIAEHIFPKLKLRLRKEGISYIEMNDNVFIQKKQLYIFIDTQKKQLQKKKETNRAFTKTGLKV